MFNSIHISKLHRRHFCGLFSGKVLGDFLKSSSALTDLDFQSSPLVFGYAILLFYRQCSKSVKEMAIGINFSKQFVCIDKHCHQQGGITWEPFRENKCKVIPYQTVS